MTTAPTGELLLGYCLGAVACALFADVGGAVIVALIGIAHICVVHLSSEEKE